MSNESLINRIIGSNSRELDQTLPNQYLSNQYSIRQIAGEVTLRIALAAGGIAAICGAVEIARYYHLANYFR